MLSICAGALLLCNPLYAVPEAQTPEAASDQGDPAAAVNACLAPRSLGDGRWSFRNLCPFEISARYCVEGRDCSGPLPLVALGPRSMISAAAFRSPASWLACRAPLAPQGARHVAGEGVTGACR